MTVIRTRPDDATAMICTLCRWWFYGYRSATTHEQRHHGGAQSCWWGVVRPAGRPTEYRYSDDPAGTWRPLADRMA